MKIYRISADELTSDLVEAWSDIQRAVPSLDSPCFRPEFAQAMQRASGNVEIGIVDKGGQPIGFFPYYRAHGNVARPVGQQISEFEGVVIRPGVALDPIELVRGCGLSAWQFNHLVMTQPALQPYVCVRSPSAYVDLGNGVCAYYAGLDESARNQVAKNRKHRRKAERELGPIRFEAVSQDLALLRQLVAWKSDQCRRTGVADIFALPWVQPLMESTVRESTPALSGVLSALYLGDRLAAVSFALRSYDVVMGVFSAYDTSLSLYGPGLMLIYARIEAAPALGIRRFDFGTGMPLYKTKLLSGSHTVGEGSVDLRLFGSTVYRGWLRTKDWLRRSRFRMAAHRINRVISSTRNWLKLHS